jgi:hypothetical protein
MLTLTYGFDRPLLRFAAPVVGFEWMATARLALDCLTMAATGWVIGRVSRPGPMLGVLAFAATLIFWEPITRLLRLLAFSLHDSRFLDSLGTLAASQALLFGCLVGGGLLSRPRTKPLSIT